MYWSWRPGNRCIHSYTLMRRVSIWQKVEDVEGIALDREQPLMSQANEEGILLCAAISENGVLTHIPRLGPYKHTTSADFFRHSLQGHNP